MPPVVWILLIPTFLRVVTAELVKLNVGKFRKQYFLFLISLDQNGTALQINNCLSPFALEVRWGPKA